MKRIALTVLMPFVLLGCSTSGPTEVELDRLETWSVTLTSASSPTKFEWELHAVDSAKNGDYGGKVYVVPTKEFVGRAIISPLENGTFFVTVNLAQGQHRMMLVREGDVMSGYWEKRNSAGSVDVAGCPTSNCSIHGTFQPRTPCKAALLCHSRPRRLWCV